MIARFADRHSRSQCLLGYMIFSSSVLLGMLGGLLWYTGAINSELLLLSPYFSRRVLLHTALIIFDLPCDMVTFFTVLYNFSIVGVMAIFYQTGIPMLVTQGYLVATTVILAWNLSKFDEWTCWALLVALAFWDLCAVLTPCGPLQMLVGLMQERNEPLPGLLYEAQLPPPPEQLRHYNSMGRTNTSGAVEMQSTSNPLVTSPSDSEDEHYSSHTDLGAERMFPRRAPHHSSDGEGGSTDEPKLKIPSLGALGLGVVGLGMMANGKVTGDGKTKIASSPSTGSYSDIELSDNSMDRSNTALRTARDRDSSQVTSARPMNRTGQSAASPPTRVVGGDSERNPQGVLIYSLMI